MGKLYRIWGVDGLRRKESIEVGRQAEILNRMVAYSHEKRKSNKT